MVIFNNTFLARVNIVLFWNARKTWDLFRVLKFSVRCVAHGNLSWMNWICSTTQTCCGMGVRKVSVSKRIENLRRSEICSLRVKSINLLVYQKCLVQSCLIRLCVIANSFSIDSKKVKRQYSVLRTLSFKSFVHCIQKKISHKFKTYIEKQAPT